MMHTPYLLFRHTHTVLTEVINLIDKLERLIINNKPVPKVTIYYTFISLIYFLNRDTLYITTNIMFTTKFKHLLEYFRFFFFCFNFLLFPIP